MSTIELIGVTKSWQQTVAIENVSFLAPEGRFLVLLGPSGCGKSTTLRMIAGLESVTAGTVRIAGKDVTDLPPAERRISMVFQSYALFPHLNVAENIIFGLKVRKVGANERRSRLQKVANLVGLSGLMNRKPAQLSGGQRQRVALARAIVAENPICLMDEPLSNLDAKLRHEMRVEIRALQNRLGMTVVYVTHDQTEAMSMADKVILMRDGRIEQEGSPDQLYKRPESVFSAQFIGTPPMNVLTLKDSAKGGVLEGAEQYPLLNGRGAGFKLGVRPEDVSITENGVPAKLIAADYLGADSIVTARIGPQDLVLRLSGHVEVKGGDEVKLSWAEDATHLFDAATGRRASH
ncbi:MAG TPA: ABC transporter ATP-binding protein [Gammaproteobacteria bacterium]|nr:ABC transporter ATP-binding protein [Gammaproteobacteria bacterium]